MACPSTVEEPYRGAPVLAFLEGDVFGLTPREGNADWCAFYDSGRELISEPYENEIALRGETVLYTARTENGRQLVLADVFTGTVLDALPVGMRSATGMVWNSESDEETASWRITNPAGDSYEKKTVFFPGIQVPDEP